MRGSEVGRWAQVVWKGRGAAHVAMVERERRETGPLTHAAGSLGFCSVAAWRSE